MNQDMSQFGSQLLTVSVLLIRVIARLVKTVTIPEFAREFAKWELNFSIV